MNDDYQELGYCVVRGLFSPAALRDVQAVLQEFHDAWLRGNYQSYQSGAVNSSYLTGPAYLDASQRRILFQFIAGRRLMKLVSSVIPVDPAFLNTQLFFNPQDSRQCNYWHRDIQYSGVDIVEQKRALIHSNVVHFRIPLQREYGLELVPGSHRAWDTEEEFAVRMELQNRQRHENLSSGRAIPLEPGDLLVFSANMIHRGLYGLDRFALDILFCDSDPKLLKYAHADCLPDAATLRSLENGVAFDNTRKVLAKQS